MPKSSALLYIGITPACAGKSHRWRRPGTLLWDHPRVCGEKGRISKHPLSPTGSPPRVRGKGYSDIRILTPQRITPACAGKRAAIDALGPLVRDHPRVCGEKFSGKTSNTFHPGSPPRVRGKVPPITKRLLLFRITPACAGKSDGLGWHSCCPGDHPRVCGEKEQISSRQDDPRGSPPRVRGKVADHLNIARGPGITPACAGKSGTGDVRAGLFWDHPRVCGEKSVNCY